MKYGRCSGEFYVPCESLNLSARLVIGFLSGSRSDVNTLLIVYSEKFGHNEKFAKSEVIEHR